MKHIPGHLLLLTLIFILLGALLKPICINVKRLMHTECKNVATPQLLEAQGKYYNIKMAM